MRKIEIGKHQSQMLLLIFRSVLRISPLLLTVPDHCTTSVSFSFQFQKKKKEIVGCILLNAQHVQIGIDRCSCKCIASLHASPSSQYPFPSKGRKNNKMINHIIEKCQIDSEREQTWRGFKFACKFKSNCFAL